MGLLCDKILITLFDNRKYDSELGKIYDIAIGRNDIEYNFYAKC